jgi:hypothetical protein
MSEARLAKAMRRPSALIAAFIDASLRSMPLISLTRNVVPN